MNDAVGIYRMILNMMNLLMKIQIKSCLCGGIHKCDFYELLKIVNQRFES